MLNADNRELAEITFSSANLVIPDAAESKRQKTADTLLNILEGRIRNKNTRSAYKKAWRLFFQFCSEYKLELDRFSSRRFLLEIRNFNRLRANCQRLPIGTSRLLSKARSAAYREAVSPQKSTSQ